MWFVLILNKFDMWSVVAQLVEHKIEELLVETSRCHCVAVSKTLYLHLSTNLLVHFSLTIIHWCYMLIQEDSKFSQCD